jgi:hypothetical protein
MTLLTIVRPVQKPTGRCKKEVDTIVPWCYSIRTVTEKRVLPMMTHWYEAKKFKVDQFDMIVDWTYEDCAIRDCFDEEVSDVAEMERRCEAYLDTHYVARVRAMYDGVEMGSAVIGSCYAYDCSPEDDINDGIGGYLEDMVDEAVDQARTEAVAMLQRLKEDFLQ